MFPILYVRIFFTRLFASLFTESLRQILIFNQANNFVRQLLYIVWVNDKAIFAVARNLRRRPEFATDNRQAKLPRLKVNDAEPFLG